MPTLLAPVAIQQFKDNNGNSLIGGQLFTYQAGTSIPAPSYTDATGTSANTNPVILNSRGEAPIWLTPGQFYKLILQDAAGVLIWSADQVPGGFVDAALLPDTASSNKVRADLTLNTDSTKGSNLIGFLPSGPGAIGRTLQSKLRDSVSVKDFGAVGDGVTNDTVAIQAACNAAKFVYVPATANGYRVTAPINITTGLKLLGDGTIPFGANGPYTSRGAGSWFFLDHPGVGFNVANSNGASFVTTANFVGIGTYRNHVNTINATWTPTFFDFDFVCNNADMLMDDVMILNAFRGVNVLNGNAGRLTVNNLRGQWFQIGVNVDKAFDTVRLNNVHMWPFWSNDPNVTLYQQNNTTLISLNRCDNPQFSNIFSIYTNIALAIYQNASGTTSKLHIVNMDNDFTKNGLLVDGAVNGFTAQLVNVSNYGPATPDASAYNIRILGSYCRVDYVNVEASNLSLGLMRVEGTGNTVRLISPRVNTWARLNANAPVIDVLASNIVYLTDRLIAEGTPGTVLFNASGLVKYPQFVTSGSSSILATNTSVLVSHTLPFTPTLAQIQVTLTGGTANAKNIWITNATASQFTVNCDVAPGTPLFFVWRAALD